MGCLLCKDMDSSLGRGGGFSSSGAARAELSGPHRRGQVKGEDVLPRHDGGVPRLIFGVKASKGCKPAGPDLTFGRGNLSMANPWP